MNNVWDCLVSHGAYVCAALRHQSLLSWANGEHPDQETRLHHLAALEWCHEEELDREHPHLELYLRQRGDFADVAVPQRRTLIEEMKEPLENLIKMQESVEECDNLAKEAAYRLQQHLISQLQGCADEEASMELVKAMQMMIDGRQTWRQGATQHISGMLNTVQIIIQFELSRLGYTWNPGKPTRSEGIEMTVVCFVGEHPKDESFVNFEMWLEAYDREKQHLTCAEDVTSNCQHQLISREAAIQEFHLQREQQSMEWTGWKRQFSEDVPVLQDSAQKLVQLTEQANKQHIQALTCLDENICERVLRDELL